MDKNSSKTSKKSEYTSKDKEEEEDSNDVTNKNSQIKKVFIYNNNRHLPKSNSACAIRLFYEPYYSDLKNNNNSKQVNNSKFQVEYIDLPKIKKNNSLIEKKLLQEPPTKLKIAFPNKIYGRYNGYNINYNSNNIFPNINNNYNKLSNNNYGYNNNINYLYNYYRNKNKELGDLYYQVYLSGSKIRNYSIKCINQQNYDTRLFIYNQMKNNPRKCIFRNIKTNNRKISGKLNEYIFFQNLKKYIEPKKNIRDEEKLNEKRSRKEKEEKNSEESSDEEEEEEYEKESKEKDSKNRDKKIEDKIIGNNKEIKEKEENESEEEESSDEEEESKE